MFVSHQWSLRCWAWLVQPERPKWEAPVCNQNLAFPFPGWRLADLSPDANLTQGSRDDLVAVDAKILWAVSPRLAIGWPLEEVKTWERR